MDTTRIVLLFGNNSFRCLDAISLVANTSLVVVVESGGGGGVGRRALSSSGGFRTSTASNEEETLLSRSKPVQRVTTALFDRATQSATMNELDSLAADGGLSSSPRASSARRFSGNVYGNSCRTYGKAVVTEDGLQNPVHHSQTRGLERGDEVGLQRLELLSPAPPHPYLSLERHGMSRAARGGDRPHRSASRRHRSPVPQSNSEEACPSPAGSSGTSPGGSRPAVCCSRQT